MTLFEGFILFLFMTSPVVIPALSLLIITKLMCKIGLHRFKTESGLYSKPQDLGYCWYCGKTKTP